jgi:hypothetical protein
VFAGRRIAVIGGGKSALESAALLHEAGAHVEVLVRAPEVRWLRYGTDSRLHAALHSERNPLKGLLFPPSDIGPPGINLLVDKPALFTRIPTRELQDRIAYRAIRPAGSGWLRARLASVSSRRRWRLSPPGDGPTSASTSATAPSERWTMRCSHRTRPTSRGSPPRRRRLSDPAHRDAPHG